MTMRLLLTLVLLYPWLGLSATEIYKTVDEDGRVIFTDRPGTRPGERVQLPPVNTLPAEPQTRQHTAPLGTPAPEASARYQVRIVSPQDQATVPAGQRDLAIAVHLDRPLASGHLLLFSLNGEPVEETRNNSIMIQEIPRGSHQLQVEVIDARGNSLGQSGAITVNVFRPSVLNRPAP